MKKILFTFYLLLILSNITFSQEVIFEEDVQLNSKVFGNSLETISIINELNNEIGIFLIGKYSLSGFLIDSSYKLQKSGVEKEWYYHNSSLKTHH